MAELVAALSKLSPLGLLMFLLTVLLAYIVYLIVTRRLVSRADLDDVRRDRDAQVAMISADRDEWRETARTTETARQVLSEQVGDLLEVARATDQLIRALPEALRQTGGRR